ncbi:MAG: hypothetical protein Q8P24_09945 [Desulfobacterales bacterium]|nr:hypothetical protein [Desulfobacterales bacterium]
MHFKKTCLLITLSLFFVFWGCPKKEEKAEAPKQKTITKNLVPPKAEIQGEKFLIKLSNIRAVIVEDIVSRKIVETPALKAGITITNLTKNILDIEAITLEFLDETGKPIEFESGEKVAQAHLYLKVIKPEGSFKTNLDATIPRSAIKQNSLSKMKINLVYTEVPFKRETITFSGKIE